MALTVILDTGTGKPVAILNATRLTDMRTGAAGAVACKYLSPKKDVVTWRHRYREAGGGAGLGHLPGAEDRTDQGLEPR